MDNMRLSDDAKSIFIVDQTLLPNELREIELRTAKEMFEAIFYLKIRGAPAIGIFAGYCLYILSVQADAKDAGELIDKLKSDADYLNSSRPTAVNLGWALRRMLSVAESAAGEGKSVEDIRGLLYNECVAIHDEDRAMCMAITEYGLSLIDEGDGILTHCNAGALATSKYGTAQGPFILGAERGMKFKVFADETRPLLQGARLTAYELFNAGVDVTLICDNMASIVMKNGWVQKCFVGCDRIAANGDVANKIGTSGVAILAKYYGIPVYSLGPTSTIDLNCKTGGDIKIELRDPDEIRTMFYEKPMAPEGVNCYNPAFDVTDHSLLAGIVTEKGICRPPFTESLKALFE